MEKEEIKKYLKQAFWDRVVDSECIYNILFQNQNPQDGITREKIYLRLLESYSWYIILDIISFKYINEVLADSIVSKIWNKPLRLKYEYARALLSR